MALRPNHADVRNIKELATTFRWGIQFARTPSGLAVPANFNVQCTTSEIPRKDAMQPIEVRIRGHHIDRPGIVDSSHTITVNFIESIDNAFTLLTRDWRRMTWSDEEGIQQDMADLQADLVLSRLDNKNRPIWKYTLINCYPNDGDPGGELGSDAEALRPTMTLYYDTFKSEPV